MIPVPVLTAVNEPPLFDVNCRQPGAAWLQAHPIRDPHEKGQWWQQFQPMLAHHFTYRCGWLAVCIELDGVVDHYLSCGHRNGEPSPHRSLAFEWSNFRYCCGTINSLKSVHDSEILDPCSVLPGWFEVLLPSFDLVPTERLPPHLRTKADFTIRKLQLGGRKARFTRWRWYLRYWNNGTPDLGALRCDAPLVAEAIESAVRSGKALPDPGVCEPDQPLEARRRPYAPRPRRDRSAL